MTLQTPTGRSEPDGLARALFYEAIRTSDTHKLCTRRSRPYSRRRNKLTTVSFHEQADWPVRGTTSASELLIVMTELPWIDFVSCNALCSEEEMAQKRTHYIIIIIIIFSQIRNQTPAHAAVRLSPHTHRPRISSYVLT